tara:strand:- start:70 stop:597 length:528 start_codon:yes stop_codon:yes gene_type:complete
MDDFSFYKSAYDNELVRRDNLDNAVNPPIVVLTVLIGAISYLLSNIDLRNADNFTITILVLVGISALAISIAIFFLARSYNNLFIGFKYLSYPYLSELRVIQNEKIPEYNSNKKKKEKVDFEEGLIERFIKYADNYFKINDKRASDLYKAKSFIIGSMVLILISVTTYQLKQIFV